MIESIRNREFEIRERPQAQMELPLPTGDFEESFGSANETPLIEAATGSVSELERSAAPMDTASTIKQTLPGNEALGEPDVQDWLDSYWTQQGAPSEAELSFQPAANAGSNFPAGTVYGPGAIYTQALDNQIGNSFATLTGMNPAGLTGQLPGVPTQQVQQEFDQALAIENAGRLASGQAIDTAAYWADPGSINFEGHTYTAQELGYVGPGKSSGPEPIFISTCNQIIGTDTFSVPGYNGTVTGIQPGKYYTLAQLEAAGLPAGQPNEQLQPGSWSTTQNS